MKALARGFNRTTDVTRGLLNASPDRIFSVVRPRRAHRGAPAHEVQVDARGRPASVSGRRAGPVESGAARCARPRRGASEQKAWREIVKRPNRQGTGP